MSKKVNNGYIGQYGNPDFKDLDPDRELNQQEIDLALAEYQRNNNIRRAAAVIHIEPERMNKIISSYAEERPEILIDPTPLKEFGKAMIQSGWDLLEHNHRVMQELVKKGKLNPRNLPQSASFAFEKGKRMVNEWAKQKGARIGEGPDPKKVAEEDKELDELLKRYSQRSPASSGEAEAAKAGTRAARAVGVDEK